MMPNLVVRYTGRRNGARVAGFVVADGLARARARVAGLGVTGARLHLQAWASLRLWLQPRFDPFDLETFYAFLARAIDRGYSRTALLADALEIAQDLRLRMAVAVLRDMVQEGTGLGRAMAAAGFPARDWQLVVAGEEAGNLVPALASLAREVRREAELGRAMRRMLLSPAVLAVSAYVLAYCALVLLSPSLGRVFEQNAQVIVLPAYARTYYALVAGFNEHLLAASTLYALAGLGTWVFLRSRACHRALMFLVPGLARIAQRAEMAQLWGAFSAMVQGGMSPTAVARQLALAARSDEAHVWFRRFERQCQLGVSNDLAVERAGFPRYVVAGVKAACGAGALAEGTAELSERLGVQVAILTHRAQSLVSGICAVTGAAIVLAFAAITILPQLTGLLGSF